MRLPFAVAVPSLLSPESETAIVEQLNATSSWAFDVFKLADLCRGKVMATIGLKLFQVWLPLS